jgi:hypothetical protein
MIRTEDKSGITLSDAFKNLLLLNMRTEILWKGIRVRNFLPKFVVAKY